MAKNVYTGKITMREYVQSATARAFHASNKSVRVIKGPVGCLPGYSEYLSPGGWCRMDEYRDGGQVAQWDPGSGSVSFVVPERYIAVPASRWVKFSRDAGSFRLEMSDDHRMPVYRRYNSEWRRKSENAVELSELKGQVKFISTYTVPDRADPVSDAMIRYAVALNADGNLPKDSPKAAVFAVHRPRKAERLRWLFSELSLDYTEHTYPLETGGTYYKFWVRNSPYRGKTFDSPFFWAMGGSELRVLVEELVHWDGHRRGATGYDKKLVVFDTAREPDVGFIQYAANGCGFRSVVEVVPPSCSRHNYLYRVKLISPASLKFPLALRKGGSDVRISQSAPGERKYCFTVPTGHFLIRQCGQVFVSQNSGKSVCCAMELFSRALEQKPNADGVRKTRFAIVRNTYPELASTTLKTVMDWIPEGVMKYKYSPPLTGLLDQQLGDGTRVHSEWLFLALDDEKDIGKLKSLEVTMVWLNEASEIQREILDMSTMRAGRYPAKIEVETTFSGVIADSNPPDDTHWIYELGEKLKPPEFVLFNQPPAVLRVDGKDGEIRYVRNDGSHSWYDGPPAENIEHLPGGWDYYMKPLASGKDHNWVRVFFMGEYGTTATGRPVFFEYNDSLHFAKEKIQPYRAQPLVLGWDFGLNASCVMGQLCPNGGLNILDELTSVEMGIERFVKDLVIPKLKSDYPELRVLGCGDPAGTQRSQTTEVTCFQILLENGFDVIPAMTNEFAARREAVAYFLTRMVNGKPAFQLSPECPILRKALLGNYQYRRMRIGGSNRYTDRPDKNEYSHLADALQYLCLYFRDVGAGARGFDPRGADGPHSSFFGPARDLTPPPPRASFSGWV